MDEVDQDLLLYARSHAIAADSSRTGPAWFSPDLRLHPEEWDDKIDHRFKAMYNEFNHNIRTQKLDISLKSGRLAYQAMREETTPLEVNWSNFLPEVPRHKTLTLEEPVEAKERDLATDKKENGTASHPISVLTSPSDSPVPGPIIPYSSPSLQAKEFPTSPQDISFYDLFPSTLGSLPAFMASRGVKLTNSLSSSPCFTPSKSKDDDTQQSILAISSTSRHVALGSIPGLNQYKAIPFPKKSTEDIILFLSTKLLKSHVQIIQHFEKYQTPPRIIYRDHSCPGIPFKNDPSTTSLSARNHELNTTPEEANIVISATTGVVLTTIQALTQLYLPGHSSTDPLVRSNKNINSPILEKIFRLAPRYEQIYILFAHSAGPASTVTSQNTTVKVDRPLEESVRSLNMLCASLSTQTTIIPLTICSDQSTMAECILSLACKHAPNIKSIHQFTTIPSESNTQLKLQQLIKEDETSFEISLRQSGLNPFAARVVLDLMELQQRSEAYFNIEKYQGSARSHVDENEAMSYALAAFIDMTHAERMDMFKDWIGERVLIRLCHVLRKSGKARSRD
ncbi:hypothetical protein N7495_006487 [Penicillium taxi]|uniref:uncharacterized protein n=1 Tax=Penicillium taxi TaxID=168475 RepID=UPI002545469D|nr:uncharacterized protein N7495_006487 [Penicillium taxi]KAJ5894796.1 hypothetical protein N7495_006487 [Penicillium taxi]